MIGRSLRRGFALLFLLGLATAGSAGALAPEAVPLPPAGSWVVDLTGTLPAETLQALDALGDRVQRERGAELAVVVVETVQPADTRSFAVALFNRWQVGDRRWNNGVLVFAALGDRGAEIVLGDGVTSEATHRRAREVMDELMLPQFRAGAPAAATEASPAAQPSVRPLARPLPVATPTPLTEPVGASRSNLGTPVLVLVFLALAALWYLLVGRRSRPPRCETCRQPMILLGEAADDAKLTPAERAEERVGSVDHLVWQCPTCLGIEKTERGRWFSGFARCPQCEARTQSTVETTLRAATEQQEGLVRIQESCAHCGYACAHERWLARLPAVDDEPRRSSSLAGSFSSSSSQGSARSSSSADSPASSRSFDGGRSSGGGASGKW